MTKLLLPFVSRERFDEAKSERDRRIDELSRELKFQKEETVSATARASGMVALETHDQVIATLQKQIEELHKQLAAEKDDQRKLMDYLLYQMVGRRIFEPDPHSTREIRPKADSPLTPVEQEKNDVAQAIADGCRSANEIARYVTRVNESRFARKRQQELSTEIPVPDDFEVAIAEGQAAAMAHGAK